MLILPESGKEAEAEVLAKLMVPPGLWTRRPRRDGDIREAVWLAGIGYRSAFALYLYMFPNGTIDAL